MAEHSTSTIYVKHIDLPDIDIRHLPLLLCNATNELVPDHVQGALISNGIWTILLKSIRAKDFLIDEGKKLEVRNIKIPIYKEYPIIARRPPTERVLFKDLPFHVSDNDILDYLYSTPEVKLQNKKVIPARIRNQKSELTPYLSGDRFIYVRGDFRRVLPSVISINNQKCRVYHQSQDLACSRCRYLGHSSTNIAACDAYSDDPNVITIRSPKNVLCNYYPCKMKLYNQQFKSSEQCYQWKFCKHIGRDDLADEILMAMTPEEAKEISSRVPPHLHGTWSRIKIEIMEEILEAKLDSCPEFNRALINSTGKRLVEAVRSDIFWSSGLNPREAETTKPQYYPGQNHLGYLLEHIRSNMLLDKTNINKKNTPNEEELVLINKSIDPPSIGSSDVPLPSTSSTASTTFTISDSQPSTTDPSASSDATPFSSDDNTVHNPSDLPTSVPVLPVSSKSRSNRSDDSSVTKPSTVLPTIDEGDPSVEAQKTMITQTPGKQKNT